MSLKDWAEIMFLFTAAGLMWLVTLRLLFCSPCGAKDFSVFIRFSQCSGVSTVDNTIPLPGSSVATAVIRQAGVPVPGAVFDADPIWAVGDQTIITFQPTGVQTGLVTAVAAGTSSLSVSGTYLGNAVSGQAVVTVTAVVGGFDVDIQWANNPTAGAVKK